MLRNCELDLIPDNFGEQFNSIGQAFRF